MFWRFFSPFCIADFSLWALDWIYLFICVLFQVIDHFDQTASEIFIWQLPGFSMPELSACGERSFGGARLRVPSCFLPFRAVIWVSAGLDFSSGVWEGACYCTVCSWRLLSPVPLSEEKMGCFRKCLQSPWLERHGRSHAPPCSLPTRFLYSPSFLLTLACELLVALWISKAFPLFLCWW